LLLTVTPEIVSAPLPLLLRVTLCVVLVVPRFCEPNPRLVGKTNAIGAVPVPERLTDSGLSAALSVNVSKPEIEPVVEGEKLT